MQKKRKKNTIKPKFVLTSKPKKSRISYTIKVFLVKMHDTSHIQFVMQSKQATKKEYGNLSTNIYQAANFLVQMFYYSDMKYHCTRAKIEKMLSIANLFYMYKYNIELFEEKICINKCGTGYSQLVSYLPNDIIGGTVPETNQPVDGINKEDLLSKINTIEKCPIIYNVNILNLQDEIQDLLFNIFIRFGNCESVYLGQKLDEFKDEIAVESPLLTQKRFVDLNVAKSFFEDSPNISNEIIKFIVE